MDKDPTAIDDFIEKGSSFESRLKKDKEFINLELKSLEIKNINLKSNVYQIKVSLLFNSGLQTEKLYLIKLINQKFKFIDEK